MALGRYCGGATRLAGALFGAMEAVHVAATAPRDDMPPDNDADEDEVMQEKESFAVDEEVDLSFSSSRNGKRRNGQICYDS